MSTASKTTTTGSVDPKIKKCWDDHVEAHNEVDYDGMAATYTDDCHIYYYNYSTGENREFNGIEGKKAFAVEHLNSLKMKDGSGPPLANINVKNYFNGNTLFNQWNIHSDNYSYADGSDVFVFGGPDMLITHHYQWYFGTKFVDSFETPAKCLEAYQKSLALNDVLGTVNTLTEDCVVSFFNLSTNKRIEANGLEEAKKVYSGFLKLIAGHEVTIAKGPKNSNNNLTQGETAFYAYEIEGAGISKGNEVFTFGGSPENKIKHVWACYDGPDIDVDTGIIAEGKTLKDLTNRILHFNINCIDLDTSKKFYESLGFSVVPGFGGRSKNTDMSQVYFGKSDVTDIDFVHMKLGVEGGVETRIDLVQWYDPAPHGESKKDPTSSGIARFSLFTDKIFEAYDLLKKEGVTFVVPENNGPLVFGGEQENKEDNFYLLPFYDPDGNMLQYLQGPL